MKMYEALTLQNFYTSVQDKKMPIKTAYKLSRLAKRVEEELQFYQKEFARIVDEYALKEDGQLIYSEDMTSIKIIPGKEDECSAKIMELKDLEVVENIELLGMIGFGCRVHIRSFFSPPCSLLTISWVCQGWIIVFH